MRIAMVKPASACMVRTRAASCCASASAVTEARDDLRGFGMDKLQEYE
jgi:hypothetical protein